MNATPDKDLRHRIRHISPQGHHGYAPHSHAESAGHEGVPHQADGPAAPDGHYAGAQRLLAVIDDELADESMPRSLLELAVIALAHATLAACEGE
jgi:hypothetical protein